MNKNEFKQWIKGYEKFKSKPYVDTVGKLTIGYGRNIEDNGISIQEAEYLLDNDIKKTEHDLLGFSWYIKAPGNVKDALMNMCFNLGLPKLLTFKNMIRAINNGDYTQAALEALNSKWATQVGDRAKDVALMLRETNNN